MKSLLCDRTVKAVLKTPSLIMAHILPQFKKIKYMCIGPSFTGLY